MPGIEPGFEHHCLCHQGGYLSTQVSVLLTEKLE